MLWSGPDTTEIKRFRHASLAIGSRVYADIRWTRRRWSVVYLLHCFADSIVISHVKVVSAEWWSLVTGGWGESGQSLSVIEAIILRQRSCDSL